PLCQKIWENNTMFLSSAIHAGPQLEARRLPFGSPLTPTWEPVGSQLAAAISSQSLSYRQLIL
ncbi:MAG: hypothetical protein ACOCN0_02960, partial [Prevotella sp.]